MMFSIPWGLTVCGGDWSVEQRGVYGLLLSVGVSFLLGLTFLLAGRHAKIQLFRKEAMAVVGLSWILVTLLGALPYLLSGVERAKDIRMNVFDAMFESQSGFSTTGSTTLSELENRSMVPRCLLFWRSSTQFLGGLGIIVFMVAILGHGTFAKSVFRAERSGPPGQNSSQTRVQKLAWTLLFLYLVFNVILTLILQLEGLPFFDAVCHAFTTIATGGFSTFNASAGHFITAEGYNGPLIEWTLIIFMFLGGTNFILFYGCFRGNFKQLFTDMEWRTYVVMIVLATLIVFAAGYWHHDFDYYGTSGNPIMVDADGHPPETDPHVSYGFRNSCFQVVSLITSTGFCTDEFERWNAVSCAMLLIVMFTGACSGSTAGGTKLIRCILSFKLITHEVERSYRPNVVRNVWLQGEMVDRDLLVNVAVFVLIYMTILCFGTLAVTIAEPDNTWLLAGNTIENKLTDSFGAVLTCLSNDGPGLGIVGARQNFGQLTSVSKFLLTWIMMIGRLEIFGILALFSPSFWKSH
jgi:trk system potassium uptake protein TrkH